MSLLKWPTVKRIVDRYRRDLSDQAELVLRTAWIVEHAVARANRQNHDPYQLSKSKKLLDLRQDQAV